MRMIVLVILRNHIDGVVTYTRNLSLLSVDLSIMCVIMGLLRLKLSDIFLEF
jgi:hypothetical protein